MSFSLVETGVPGEKPLHAKQEQTTLTNTYFFPGMSDFVLNDTFNSAESASLVLMSILVFFQNSISFLESFVKLFSPSLTFQLNKLLDWSILCCAALKVSSLGLYIELLMAFNSGY